MIDRIFTQTANCPGVYRIVICGRIGENWLEGFNGISVHFDGNNTTLTSAAIDQAALRGLLSWLWDLNLILLSATRFAEACNEEGENVYEQDDTIL